MLLVSTGSVRLASIRKANQGRRLSSKCPIRFHSHRAALRAARPRRPTAPGYVSASPPPARPLTAVFPLQCPLQPRRFAVHGGRQGPQLCTEAPDRVHGDLSAAGPATRLNSRRRKFRWSLRRRTRPLSREPKSRGSRLRRRKPPRAEHRTADAASGGVRDAAPEAVGW